jgi:two-component system response regulator YesN
MFSMLIVDDETIIRNSISRRPIWRELGIGQVENAATVAQAREMMQASAPDILLTDLVMPHEDGFVLMRFARENAPNTRVIVLSGYNQFTYAAEAMRLGARGYVLKPTDDAQIRKVFEEVLEELRKEHAADMFNACDYGVLRPVLEYIHVHYAKPISLDEAAAIVHMNPSYFSATFSRIRGMSFVQYVNFVRVERAKQLLMKAGSRVQQVSDAVGFRDATYFGRVFCRHTGMTPVEWRKRQ